jgi:Fic-DOC domain mobile mystery protein B
MKIKTTFGATPLDPNEIAGLIPDIHTHQELDQHEFENITKALYWANKSRKLKKELLSVSGLLTLHKQMFNNVWTWAGTFRSTEKNIGVCPTQIAIKLSQLAENINFQIQNQTSQIHQISISFHHQLTLIHPFPNGNGRHARAAADLLLIYQKKPPFNWSASQLRNESDTRLLYIQALKIADQSGDYQPLLQFALNE